MTAGEHYKDALRELVRQLRNDIWSLQLRSDLTAEGVARRCADLKKLAAEGQAILKKAARRR